MVEPVSVPRLKSDELHYSPRLPGGFGSRVECTKGTVCESGHHPDVRYQALECGSGNAESEPVGRGIGPDVARRSVGAAEVVSARIVRAHALAASPESVRLFGIE